MSKKHTLGRFTTSEREIQKYCDTCKDATEHIVKHSIETIYQGTDDKK